MTEAFLAQIGPMSSRNSHSLHAMSSMVPSKNEMVHHDESESYGSDSGANVGKEPVAEAIAQQESRDVASLRLAVLAVMVCSAVAIAVSINRYVVTSEEEQFTDRFQSDSNKIFEAVGDR
jgi:predicted lysophospholipase L1 biosynthesis ABC-type transport system permease subunit